MKAKAVGFFLSLLAIYVVSISRSNGLAFANNQDNTGSPFSSGSCGSCHSGGNFSPTIGLQVLDGNSNPVTTYSPNQNYVLRFTVSGVNNPQGYGMQGVALTSNNGNAGNLSSVITNQTRISLLGGRKYAEHNGINPLGVFELNWTAPIASTGPVTFYYAGVAVNANGGTSGDRATAQVSTVLNEACTPPVANFSFSVNGATASFSDNSTNVPTNWHWDFGDGGTSTGQNPSHTYTSPGNYTVCLIVGGCAADTICKIVAVTCTGISVSTVSQSNLLCFGDSTGSATVSATGGIAPYNFVWSTLTQGPTATGLTNGSYAVTVTDSNGCTATSIVQITSPAPLKVSLQTTDVLCSGDSTGTATAVVTGGAGGNNFLWSDGQTSQIASGLPADSIMVLVTDTNGCTAADTAILGTLNTPIILSFTSSPETNGNSDGSIDLSASGGSPPYIFVWSNGASTEDLGGLSSGTYTVTVIDTLGCFATDSIFVDLSFGLAEELPRSSLLIYPNPNHGFLQFGALRLKGKVSIEVNTASGARVFWGEFPRVPANLELNSLEKGLYFIRISGKKGHQSGRFIIE